MKLTDLNVFDFWYVVFVLFVVGACIGSFLNVVVLRAFSGESIVLPPSKCPECHNKLKWYHNIPILSYIFLRGKCGFCGCRISPQYPIVELVFALLFTTVFLKFGITLKALFLMLVAAMCLVLALTDIKEQVIFDVHAYILAAVGLVYNYFDIGKTSPGTYDFSLFSQSISINKSFIYAVLGLIAGFLAIELLSLVGKLLAGKRAFGEGDSFILGALGAVFGLKAVPQILILGCIVQVVAILPMFLKKLYDNKEYKLICALGAFVLSVILFKVFEINGLTNNLFVFAAAFLLMGIIAIYACKKLIDSTKSEAGLTYVPFGPPLVVSALILMFII